MKSFLAGVAAALGLALIVEARQRKRTAAGRVMTRVPQPRQHRRTEANRHPGPIAVSEAQPRPEGTDEPQRSRRSAEEVLNSASRQQLMSVYGIGPVLADRIIQNRPYTAAYEVVERGIIPESIFVQLRKQLLEQFSA